MSAAMAAGRAAPHPSCSRINARRLTNQTQPEITYASAYMRSDFARPLRGFVEQLPPDQHAADFAGARADFIELGVAQQPAGRIVIDVAVAAQKLNRIER